MARSSWRIACVAILAALTNSLVAAQEQPPFYAGKQIRAIVSTQAGGDYDLWMRLIAPFISRYIPGNPTILVQNMPGGGSLVATNYLYNVAPRDGMTIGMIGRNLPFQAVLGDPAIRFDMTQFGWIGNPEVTNRVCAQRPDTGVETARDLFERQLLVGGAGAGGALSTIPQLLSRMLGLKLKLIEGYEGPRDVLLAMERKELDGVCMSVTAIENIRPGWMADGRIRLLFNMEPKPLPGTKVPSIFDLTRSDEERQMLTLFSTGVLFGRPIVTPPQVPKELTATIKAAFEKAMQDPELIAKARTAGLEIGVVRGDELAATMADLLKTPRPVVERMKQFMQ